MEVKREEKGSCSVSFSGPAAAREGITNAPIPAGMQKWPSDHRLKLLPSSGRVSRAFSSSMCQAQGAQIIGFWLLFLKRGGVMEPDVEFMEAGSE